MFLIHMVFWWENEKSLRFYLNGEEIMHIVPHVDFNEDLFLIFDTEVFTWVGLPLISALKDDSKNTMLIDFVRTYKLNADPFNSGLVLNGSFETNANESWLWKVSDLLNTSTTNLNQGVYNLNLKNEGSILQKIKVEKNTNYKLKFAAKTDHGELIYDIDSILNNPIQSNTW